jgi:hypothetical protein
MYTLVNVISSIGPHMRPLSNPYQRIAAEYRAQTRPGDLIVVAGLGPLADAAVNIPYFADRPTESLHGVLTKSRDNSTVAVQLLQDEVRQTLASGHQVYLADDTYRLAHNPDVESALVERHKGVDLAALQHPYASWRVAKAWRSGVGHRADHWRRRHDQRPELLRQTAIGELRVGYV